MSIDIVEKSSKYAWIILLAKVTFMYFEDLKQIFMKFILIFFPIILIVPKNIQFVKFCC